MSEKMQSYYYYTEIESWYSDSVKLENTEDIRREILRLILNIIEKKDPSIVKPLIQCDIFTLWNESFIKNMLDHFKTHIMDILNYNKFKNLYIFDFYEHLDIDYDIKEILRIKLGDVLKIENDYLNGEISQEEKKKRYEELKSQTLQEVWNENSEIIFQFLDKFAKNARFDFFFNKFSSHKWYDEEFLEMLKVMIDNGFFK